MAIPLNFKIQGSGDPVVILHGFLGSLDNWQTFAKDLANHHMVITADQRNHGRSPHTSDFSLDLMAEDLHQLMENEWIHTATIIGHSMGGKTAMQFAMTYPDMVEKLVVLDITPRKYEAAHIGILNALNQVPIEQISNRFEADSILANDISEYNIRQFLLKNLKRNDLGFEWKMNLQVLTEQYDSILKPIKTEHPYQGPALFIGGSESKYVQEEDLPEILRLFPMANMVTIDEAGHWLHVDQPHILLKTVLDFIQKSQ